jgi:pantoate--beta-alanine ligase
MVGFVPTMGALHEGHLRLVGESLQAGGITVCSIFVNPTQFNDPADFANYPVTLEADIRLLEEAGCQVLYHPDAEEIYPGGQPVAENYDLGYLETILEGAFRPGHYQGVCMVVRRLLETVRPNRLYLGQKDYQQCLVIERLIQLMGWQEQISVFRVPTVREAGGLALSSRNRRLNREQLEQAEEIWKTLLFIRKNLHPGPVKDLTAKASARLEAAGFRVDYVSIRQAGTLQETDNWDGQEPLVALAAAFLGEVRLIDNILINE